MNNFVKLYGSIIHSSIWAQPDHVRLVWITMLAMADCDGNVFASELGIANASRQTIENTLDALKVLMGPDPYSRDGTTGERIVRIERGFHILNHAYYRNMRTPRQVYNAERQASLRARKNSSATEATVADVAATACDSVYVSESEGLGSVKEREREREEAPKKTRKAKNPKVKPNMELFEEFLHAYVKRVAVKDAEKAWLQEVGTDEALAREVIAAAKVFSQLPKVAKEDRQWQPYPATWLRKHCWKNSDLQAQIQKQRDEDSQPVDADGNPIMTAKYFLRHSPKQWEWMSKRYGMDENTTYKEYHRMFQEDKDSMPEGEDPWTVYIAETGETLAGDE